MDARGERILSDINSAFRRDPLIDEYDFLPVFHATQNKSPVILTEHKLGVELWSIKILYQYAYTTLMSWRSRQAQFKFLEPSEISSLSKAVVLINPDCYTAWNIRKELVQSGELRPMEELKLGALILTKHPKSAEVFAHRYASRIFRRLYLDNNVTVALLSRRPTNVCASYVVHSAIWHFRRKWLLKKITEKYCLHSWSHQLPETDTSSSVQQQYSDLDSINIQIMESSNQEREKQQINKIVPSNRSVNDVIMAEFQVCTLAASGYFCNYNAWNHRMWVLKHCHWCSVPIVLAELSASETWIVQNISDHSGFYYRQFLLRLLKQRYDAIQNGFQICMEELLQKELKLIVELIHFYPGHETLWYHRRFVFHTLVRPNKDLHCTVEISAGNVSSCGSSKGTNLKKSRLETTELCTSIAAFVQKEIDSANQEEINASEPFQRHLADQYLLWIRRFFLT